MLSSTPYSQTPSVYVPPSMLATKYHTHTEQRAILYFYTSFHTTIFCSVVQQSISDLGRLIVEVPSSLTHTHKHTHTHTTQ